MTTASAPLSLNVGETAEKPAQTSIEMPDLESGSRDVKESEASVVSLGVRSEDPHEATAQNTQDASSSRLMYEDYTKSHKDHDVRTDQQSSSPPRSSALPLTSSSMHSTTTTGSLSGVRLSLNTTTASPSGVHHHPATSPGPLLAGSSAPSAKRLYRSNNKWVTRDIAALDFLLGIPLEKEAEIVHEGYLLQQQRHQDDNAIRQISEDSDNHGSNTTDGTEINKRDSRGGAATSGEVAVVGGTGKRRWWEKFVKSQLHLNSSLHSSALPSDQGSSAVALAALRKNQPGTEATEQLEQPTKEEKGDGNEATSDRHHQQTQLRGSATTTPLVPVYAPGRRLEGDAAVHVQIPLTTTTVTKQRSIARQAALREWELKTAHGLNSNLPPMLDNRIFFSSLGGYPMSVFSMIRYEPRKEEAAMRRQKLEARGGGGSQFIIPARDWRGISYRALLPRAVDSEKENKAFNRFLRREHHPESDNDDDDDSSTSSASSAESDAYVPGLLDDPEMVLGRHRNVMVGDRVTGPIVASTIQFVEPALLKAELNKQFRERFDGWEPPKSARKYIGARVNQGKYVLMDPTEDYQEEENSHQDYHHHQRPRQGSVTSMSSGDGGGGGGQKEKQIRMPPSLTLSKIRSLKHQALEAAVEAKVEIGTVALACVYFERLCLDCRVDKSNRRLTFAACLLLASKLNEPNSSLVMQTNEDEEKDRGRATSTTARIQSLIRPNKRSNTMFASLLEFFTEQWQLSLKHLFDAEWGVFVALGFSLLASPSQVAFHYKRMMKTLEWNPRTYLGNEMYSHWQDALEEEERRRIQRERRKELLHHRKQQHIVSLHLELENELLRRKTKEEEDQHTREKEEAKPGFAKGQPSDLSLKAKKSGIKLLHRFGMRRVASQERIDHLSISEHRTIPHGTSIPKTNKSEIGLPASPSLPALSTICSDSGAIAIDIPEERARSETSSIESVNGSEIGGINV